jgi:MFS family permease
MNEYLSVLRIPGAISLALASMPGRLAYGMSGLAVFFHVQILTNSFASAGFAVGAYSGLSALTAALRGHAIDRFGQTKPLVILVPAFVLATFSIGFFATDARSAIILAGVMGLTAPPINLSVRPLWKKLAGVSQLRTANALDSVILNTTSLIGPVIGTYAALQLSGPVAMYITSGLMLIGGVWLVSTKISREWVPEPKTPGDLSLWKSPAMRIMAIDAVLIGLAFGLFDVGIPAQATVADIAEWAAPSLAALSLGGLIGGLIAGSKLKNVGPAKGLILSQYAFGFMGLPLFAINPGIATAVVLFFIGLPIGISQVFYLEVVELIRPTGTAVAALGSMWFIEGSAMAAGNSIAGFLSEHYGPGSALISVGFLIIASAVVLHTALHGPLKAAHRHISFS